MNRRKIFAIVGIAVVLTAVALLIYFLRQDGDLTPEAYLTNLLLPLSGDALFFGRTNASANETPSAPYQAMSWMLQQDSQGVFPIAKVSDSILTERFILSVFYFATGGPSWTYQFGFLSELSVCEWPPSNTTSRDELLVRVQCNDDGRVTSINADSNNLTGTIPPELGDLAFLVQLFAQNGLLSGSIPPELTKAMLLTHLSFNNQVLTGTLPGNDEWGRLGALQYLDLGSNLISSTIPSAFLADNTLEELQLQDNNMNGTIPEVVSRSALQKISLGSNVLTGTLPSSLFNLRALETFDVSDNTLTGTLSSRVGNLRASLQQLDLSQNQFTGPVPSEIGQLTQLQFPDGTPVVKMECNFGADDCQSCNEQGSVCAQHKLYSHYFYNASEGPGPIAADVQYIGERDESITLEYGGPSQSPWCRFHINNDMCSSCMYQQCPDGVTVHVIDCTNILGNNPLTADGNPNVAYYNGCIVGVGQQKPLGVFQALHAFENDLSSCNVGFGGLN